MEEPIFLASNLRFLRNKLDITAQQLITNANLSISASTYFAYEDSRSNVPKYHVLKAILRYYNKEFEESLTIENMHEHNIELLGLPQKTTNQQEKIELMKMEIDKINAETKRSLARAAEAAAEAARAAFER